MTSSSPKQSVHQQDSLDEFIESVALGILRLAGILASSAVRFPAISVPLLCAVLAALLGSMGLGMFVVGVSVVIYAGWFYLQRPSFRRVIWRPLFNSWIAWWRYQRTWEQVTTLHGLTGRINESVVIPRLASVRVNGCQVALGVKLAVGQCAADWQKRSDALAAAWRADRLVIRSTTPGNLMLTLHYGDSLSGARRVPRPGPSDDRGLRSCPIGVTETGMIWRLPILGNHILVAGATGSGKGSVVWSALAALAPSVQKGLVQFHVVDPKGGMEFGRGEKLFARFAHDNGEETLDLLRSAVRVMQERAQALRGRTRLHTPTVEDPLVLVVVDELASLTAYIGDRKIRAEVEQLLGILLSQGRAVGVSVIAAVQDPSKEVLPIRQLFTVRIGLRMTESTQTTMILGAAARDAGAVCDQLPTATPGVGYVLEDGSPEAFRVRAFQVTDEDIDYLAETFALASGPPVEIGEGEDA